MTPATAISAPDLGPVLEFLPCRTPSAWARAAIADLDTLLLDHASLELKAAQQAQKLIRKYAGAASRKGAVPGDGFRSRLAQRMSRLAREELRHFEQVLALIERRGGSFATISPSRYAAGLHELARRDEPAALVDALVIGAIIEARSCERFSSLLERLPDTERELQRFYASLLRSEARHFEDYLGLASALVPAAELSGRVTELLARERALIESPDTALRFHSGPPEAVTAAASRSPLPSSGQRSPAAAKTVSGRSSR